MRKKLYLCRHYNDLRVDETSDNADCVYRIKKGKSKGGCYIDGKQCRIYLFKREVPHAKA